MAVRPGDKNSAQKVVYDFGREDYARRYDDKDGLSGVWPSGTTYIEFDSVRVPKSTSW